MPVFFFVYFVFFVLPQYTFPSIYPFPIENHQICRVSFLYILELLNDEKHFGEINVFQQQIKVIEAHD